MKVCNHCMEDKPIKNVIKINGKFYDLCSDCSEALIARIEDHPKKQKGFAGILEKFS